MDAATNTTLFMSCINSKIAIFIWTHCIPRIFIIYCKYAYIRMIICIHKKDTLQIMAKNKQKSYNLTMPVESYTKNYICCNPHTIWFYSYFLTWNDIKTCIKITASTTERLRCSHSCIDHVMIIRCSNTYRITLKKVFTTVMNIIIFAFDR